jgi:truncated hemoglobin YjbI
MRHFGFAIGGVERDAWVRHMSDAVRASEASSGDADALIGYFASASTMLVNQPMTNTMVGRSLNELPVIHRDI